MSTFEHFVVPMQPVLAKARRSFWSRPRRSYRPYLEAERIETDFWQQRPTGFRSRGCCIGAITIKRENLVDALRALDNVSGISVTTRLDKICFRLPDGTRREYATGLEALEADPRFTRSPPLTPS